jgi:hypothetical protein
MRRPAYCPGMTNVVLSKLVVGATVCFNPIAYAMHIAEGIILRRFTDEGQLCLEVKATEGDGAGKVWTIFPEDVIFIRPSKVVPRSQKTFLNAR